MSDVREIIIMIEAMTAEIETGTIVIGETTNVIDEDAKGYI